MKRFSNLMAFLMVFNFFGCKDSSSKEAAFWKWFVANEARLFAFEKDQDAIFDELAREMHRVNTDLTFEFSPVENDRREFVISAGGIRKSFPAVEALFSSAPKLARWEWIKYRPRRFQIHDVLFGGTTVKADEVRYLMAKDGEKVGIVLFFDGYSEEEKSVYANIGYLLLDQALGEFSIETQVGFIEFHAQDSEYFAQSRPLDELPRQFDEYLGQIAH
jgi:hypothetical protein